MILFLFFSNYWDIFALLRIRFKFYIISYHAIYSLSVYSEYVSGVYFYLSAPDSIIFH